VGGGGGVGGGVKGLLKGSVHVVAFCDEEYRHQIQVSNRSFQQYTFLSNMHCRLRFENIQHTYKATLLLHSSSPTVTLSPPPQASTNVRLRYCRPPLSAQTGALSLVAGPCQYLVGRWHVAQRQAAVMGWSRHPKPAQNHKPATQHVCCRMQHSGRCNRVDHPPQLVFGAGALSLAVGLWPALC
jgi:hypothetical protein